MKKPQPLYLRLYREPHLIALVRLIGYPGLPVPEAKEQLKPLSERYGTERMKLATKELLVIDTRQEPPVARLAEPVRKLAWQLLGPPPSWAETIRLLPPARFCRVLDPRNSRKCAPMSPSKRSLHGWFVVLGWTAFGLVVGLLIAAVIWVGSLYAKGATLPKALRGEVEDGIGTLEGIALLGAVVGTGTGLLLGLSSLSEPRSR